MIKKIYLALTVLAVSLASCDDSTSSLGLYEDTDFISNSTGEYDVYSNSALMDSVKANSTNSYLGSIVDPETGGTITAEFAAQFYTAENNVLAVFPKQSLVISRDATNQDIVACDSIDVRIYFDKVYGCGLTPMKIQIYELDPKNLLEENTTYYTDIDLSKYLTPGAKPIAERVFIPEDYNLSDEDRTSTKHSANVRLMLDKTIGDRLLQKYYENADYYKNSYWFIHNVFPGLYFRISNGEGTMLSIYTCTTNLFYRYRQNEASDSIISGITRFAATPEVIQSTRFNTDQTVLNKLVSDESCTYLKTPAGVCTELLLPVDEVFSGEHAKDSLSKAELTLTRYNKSSQDDNQFDVPQELLMVRKKDMQSFFDENKVSNSKTSYTTSFSSTYNTYSFSNICRLISYIKNEKNLAVKSLLNKSSYTQEEFDAKEKEWMTNNPDWNKVVLVPVITSSSTNSSTSTTTQTSVVHDMGLNSAKLVGGKNNPIKMRVVYSKFSKN